MKSAAAASSLQPTSHQHSPVSIQHSTVPHINVSK